MPLAEVGRGTGVRAALRIHRSVLRDRLRGVGRVDLSATTDTDLETAALAVVEDA